MKSIYSVSSVKVLAVLEGVGSSKWNFPMGNSIWNSYSHWTSEIQGFTAVHVVDIMCVLQISVTTNLTHL